MHVSHVSRDASAALASGKGAMPVAQRGLRGADEPLVELAGCHALNNFRRFARPFALHSATRARAQSFRYTVAAEAPRG
jgi:hypothetical protein